jgi:hypothetical protein
LEVGEGCVHVARLELVQPRQRVLHLSLARGAQQRVEQGALEVRCRTAWNG